MLVGMFIATQAIVCTEMSAPLSCGIKPLPVAKGQELPIKPSCGRFLPAQWDRHEGPHPAWLPRRKGQPSLALTLVGVKQGSSVNPGFAGSKQWRGVLQLGKLQANPTSTSILIPTRDLLNCIPDTWILACKFTYLCIACLQ